MGLKNVVVSTQNGDEILEGKRNKRVLRECIATIVLDYTEHRVYTGSMAIESWRD